MSTHYYEKVAGRYTRQKSRVKIFVYQYLKEKSFLHRNLDLKRFFTLKKIHQNKFS